MFTGRCTKTLLLSICCWQLTTAAFSQGYEDLAALWAPTVDQFFNTAGNSSQANRAQEDTFTLFNYDFDWRANNNWSNLNYYKLKPPSVYYSVVEGDKHYYLGYYFYYPRHLGAKPHGNDFAGLAIAVEKTPANGQGLLTGILLYDDRGWREVSISALRTANSPLRMTSSAGEHAIALREEVSPLPANVLTCKPLKQSNNAAAEGHDYQLVSLEELWQHHSEIQAGAAYGTLDIKADTGSDLKDLPWKWQYRGIYWLPDPAGVFRLISGNKDLTGTYLYNPYTE